MSRSISHNSPHQERINMITQKLNGLSAATEGERSRHVDLLEDKLREIEDNYWRSQESNSKKFAFLREYVNKLQQKIDESRQHRETAHELLKKELSDMQHRIQIGIEAESSIRKEAEGRIQRYLEEKIGALRNELSSENKHRVEVMQETESKLVKLLPSLQEALVNEEDARDNFIGRLKKQFSDEGQRFYSEVEGERRTREDTEEALLTMLREVVGRMKTDLENEKTEREGTEETLLGLMEDICSKLSRLQ
mmetsp:Transcript_26022/g.46139  ORF Transcript_26022/g.46139 Transcript_26022/m.46139 type:complete len:251 (+) Transcript_26022:3882-4634(+)